MRTFLEKEKRSGEESREKHQMGPRANAAFFPTVARITVDHVYSGHRTGGAGSQWPLSGANTFLPRPFGKSTKPHFQAPAGPVSVQQPPHCGEGISLLIRALVHLLCFWPHPKTGYSHMGSRHQAKSEDQLFAKLLILASKPAAGGGKEGCLPTSLASREKCLPSTAGPERGC